MADLTVSVGNQTITHTVNSSTPGTSYSTQTKTEELPSPPYWTPLVSGRFGLGTRAWVGWFRQLWSRIRDLDFIENAFKGHMVRPRFYPSSDYTEIHITPGQYLVAGTKDKLAFWNSTITFTPGSTGSNSESIDLASGEVQHYLYIDYSTLSFNTPATAASFYNHTTAPTWNAEKQGWYSGNDRCIFAFITQESEPEIGIWVHDGGDYVTHGNSYKITAIDVTPSDSWTRINCNGVAPALPAFCRKGYFTVHTAPNGDATANTVFMRTAGTYPLYGLTIASVPDTGFSRTHVIILTDDDKQFDIKLLNASANHAVSIRCLGWFFPQGM